MKQNPEKNVPDVLSVTAEALSGAPAEISAANLSGIAPDHL